MSEDQPDPNDQSVSRKWLTLAIAFGLLSFAFFIGAKRNAVDPDLFHEISLARQAYEENNFPTTDAFSYSPTVSPVVHHEWATGAFLFWIIEVLGLKSAGLMAAKYLLITLIGITCFYVGKLKGGSIAVFAPCAALAVILGGQIGFTTIRAQVFTLLFLALQFVLLELDHRGKKWWIVPWFLIVIIWGNMHAGIVVGLGIICFYYFFRFVDEFRMGPDETSFGERAWTSLLRTQYLFWTVIASFVLLLVNPYGIDFPIYLFYGVTLERPAINEWAPLWVAIPQPGFLMMFGFAIVLALEAYRRCFKDHLFETFIVLLTAYLALKHVRHLSLFAVTWVCLVPPRLSEKPIGVGLKKFHQPLGNGFTALVAFVGIVFVGLAVQAKFWQMQVPSGQGDTAVAQLQYPVGAVEFLRESEFQGNLHVPFIVGAFVSWNLYPEVKVSIDSRYEVAYPPTALTDNHTFYAAQDGWEDVLVANGTDAVLIPSYAPVKDKMPALEGWHLYYQDPSFAIYASSPVDDPVVIEDGEVSFQWEF